MIQTSIFEYGWLRPAVLLCVRQTVSEAHPGLRLRGELNFDGGEGFHGDPIP